MDIFNRYHWLEALESKSSRAVSCALKSSYAIYEPPEILQQQRRGIHRKNFRILQKTENQINIFETASSLVTRKISCINISSSLYFNIQMGQFISL